MPGYFAVDLVFIVAHIVCGSAVLGPCIVIQYLVSFLVIAIALMRKKEVVDLL